MLTGDVEQAGNMAACDRGVLEHPTYTRSGRFSTAT